MFFSRQKTDSSLNQYIYCVPCFKPGISKHSPHQILGKDELILAVSGEGKDTRQAVFSVDLLTEQSATLIAKSYKSDIHTLETNYWIIRLDMSKEAYQKHVRNTGFGFSRGLRSFLHPIKAHIISCQNEKGEQVFIKSALIGQYSVRSGCVIS